MSAARKLQVCDLFCGAGGTSTGLALACKELDVAVELLAINHWGRAIETHKKNHPWARHICASLETLDPRKVIPGGHLDLLVASPECFPAGTLVLAKRGLLPIEAVVVGDEVLTHKNRYRRVTSVGHRVSDTIIVRGQGHYGLETTAEHPFWARSRKRSWPKANRNGVWKWGEPTWVAAKDLEKTFWSTPTIFPELQIPLGLLDAPTSGFWWLVGRWLGDGSLDDRVGRGDGVQISCGNHEVDELAPLLAGIPPGTTWKPRKTRTATLFEARHRPLVDWLVKHFGKLAYGKTMPAWALGMPREWRQALLDGYLSADGHEEPLKNDAVSVSKKLALGIRLLAESLGHRVSLYHNTAREESSVIECRKVNVRDQYRIKWTRDRNRSWHTEEADASWARVRSVSPGRQDVTLFNMSVEEDESYLADGIIVHNCTHHSTARGGRPINDQSRASAFRVLEWCDKLHVSNVLVENVPEFENWAPIGEDERPLKSKKGETFRQWIAMLEAMNYRVEKRVLNAADFGGATTRKRLFVIARKGTRRIHWPEPSHAKDPGGDLFGVRKPWRAAREIIDWTLKSESIFTRKKPLAKTTLERILAGFKKYGGKDAEPFIRILREYIDRIYPPIIQIWEPQLFVAQRHVLSLDEATPPIMTAPFMNVSHGNGLGRFLEFPRVPIASHGNRMVMADAFVLGQQSGAVLRPVRFPLPTIATAGAQALVTMNAYMIPFFGERDGQDPRSHSVELPLPAVTSHGAGALVQPTAFIITPGGADLGVGRLVTLPLPTVLGHQRFAVVTPTSILVNMKGRSNGASIHAPFPTQTTRRHLYVAEAFVLPQNSSNGPRSIWSPLQTLTTTSHGVGVVQGFLATFDGKEVASSEMEAPQGFIVGAGGPQYSGKPTRLSEPMGTLMTANHRALVSPIIVQTSNTGGNGIYSRPVSDPLYTMVTKAQLALVEGCLVMVNHGRNEAFRGQSFNDPLQTMTAKNGFGIAEPTFLVKYYKDTESQHQSIGVPLHAVTTKARFGLVESQDCEIYLDIHFRMLRSKELARAMGFEKYEFTGNVEEQTKQIGNAVEVNTAKALIKAILED